VLTEGRRFEALTAGNDQLTQLGMPKAERIFNVNRGRRCENCDTNHKPRQCPAYTSKCSSCGNMGHWAKCCRKTKYKNKEAKKTDGRHRSKSRNRYQKRAEPRHGNINYLDVGSESDEEKYLHHFHSITVSAKCMDSVTRQPRDEAYTTLKIRPPHLKYKTHHTLRMKIDSGASGNTLPLRTFQQMYGTSPKAFTILQPTPHVKLTSYSGDQIKCLGTIRIPCQFRDSDWIDAIFYVVEVPGPAIVGLPTSERLKLLTLHINALDDNTKTTPISSIDQLKSAYPEQFDRIGSFSGTAKLLLKDDAEPFIDPPTQMQHSLKGQIKGGNRQTP